MNCYNDPDKMCLICLIQTKCVLSRSRSGDICHLDVRPRGQSTDTDAWKIFIVTVFVMPVMVVLMLMLLVLVLVVVVL